MSSIAIDATNLTLRQQKLRQRLDDDMAKLHGRPATNLVDAFNKSVASSGDWLLRELGDLKLPLGLCQIIPLQLRDRGNDLIARTVAMNNQYSNVSFRTAEVLLATDAELIDLRNEVVEWGMDVAKEVIFKLRNQAKNDPVRAFFSAFDGFLCALDDDVAHCPKSVFPFAWSALIDALISELFDAILHKPGHIVVAHDQSDQHNAFMSFSDIALQSTELERLKRIFNMYAIEPLVYAQDVVLKPLLAHLKDDGAYKAPSNYRTLHKQMLSDLIEAAPYLMSSDRTDRYMFPIAGTTCFAAINFISAHGCARFVFGDDDLYVRKGLHSNLFRAALNIGSDGQISHWGHRGRTLSRAFGQEDGTLLAYWLLEQVHATMLKDYLSIEHYYLKGVQQSAIEINVAGDPEDTLAYVTWAKAKDLLQVAAPVDDADGGPEPAVSDKGMLPHLRRQYFFKMLEKCGVQVEQGKGSEIKLLRKGKRPFRLGGHNGTNPTVPAFLAAGILKRLEISRQEWLDALDGG